ncbi:pectin lyase fold/virulence factor [Ephemerocybe angulata]|uniref:galacturonan 1,4-alpha-galacturonidase n=1 Tax=Ephemerocybe angulata TaxID=980116 RepID=A0A8H6M2N2_9AGAR|nr:pectin lyase fold/virulence factor [Tulosesus angulatus]
MQFKPVFSSLLAFCVLATLAGSTALPDLEVLSTDTSGDRVPLPASAGWKPSRVCRLKPLGAGKDDTNQFEPKVEWWLEPENTYRVVFIQSQASWFVVTGSDFVIDAHKTGGVHGNGQPWTGDGRPIAFTVHKARDAVIKDFSILFPPFWASTVAESERVVFDGMVVNATNTDPRWAGQTVVWNTDGIDTYRSDRITLRNWDVTCGDDCIAVKGNSTNIVARDFVCRGGTGVAFGSLGQYNGIHDIVKNVLIENVKILRLDPKVQPNMNHGIYFKAWDGVATGTPPTGGGGGSGLVENAIFRNFVFDRVQTGFQIVQNFGAPVDEVEVSSKVKFSKMLFGNIRGTTNESTIVRFDCSSVEHCSDIRFKNVNVKGAGIQGAKDEYICKNAEGITGLPVPCGN